MSSDNLKSRNNTQIFVEFLDRTFQRQLYWIQTANTKAQLILTLLLAMASALVFIVVYTNAYNNIDLSLLPQQVLVISLILTLVCWLLLITLTLTCLLRKYTEFIDTLKSFFVTIKSESKSVLYYSSIPNQSLTSYKEKLMGLLYDNDHKTLIDDYCESIYHTARIAQFKIIRIRKILVLLILFTILWTYSLVSILLYAANTL